MKCAYLPPVVFLLTITLGSISYAGEDAKAAFEPKLEGKVYADWHYDFTEGASPASEFDLTRAYFGCKVTVGEGFLGRVVFDLFREELLTGDTEVSTTTDDSGKVETVSLDADTEKRFMGYVRYAYLEWKEMLPLTTLQFGLIGTSIYKYAEKFWGYRYIYKSFVDEKKYGSGSDLGLSLTVKPNDRLKFSVSGENGEGYKKPQDLDGRYKATLCSEIHIVEGLSTNLYADLMPFGSGTSKLQTSLLVFLGYTMDMFRIGAEFDYQMQHEGEVGQDLYGVSAYTAVSIGKVDIFARVDHLMSEDDWQLDDDGSTVIAGVHYAPIKSVKIGPNVQVAIPSAGGADTETMFFLNTAVEF